MFYAHIQQCEAKLTEASAALVTLADEVTTLRAAGAQECEAAIAELLTSTGQLQEAFEFVDVLAHNVRAATALVDATERRLDTLEAGLTLPRSIAQLPPVQFEAHQFSQQLQRRERATIPELLELSELTSRAEQEAQADAAELEHLSEIELKLEQMARDVGPLTCPPNRPPAHPHARTPARPHARTPLARVAPQGPSADQRVYCRSAGGGSCHQPRECAARKGAALLGSRQLPPAVIAAGDWRATARAGATDHSDRATARLTCCACVMCPRGGG